MTVILGFIIFPTLVANYANYAALFSPFVQIVDIRKYWVNKLNLRAGWLSMAIASPYNIFITGCGRSGTSMVAGLFRNSGRYFGDSFHEVRDNNPLGIFETEEVNGLNERILSRYTPTPQNIRGVPFACDSPGPWQRWLARIPPDIPIEADASEQQQIKALVDKQPICFKDPRFCYTLHEWLRYCPEAKVICVFRNPSVVVSSILKECRQADYLHDFAISVNQAFELWCLLYLRVLDEQRHSGDWLFIEYEQVFDELIQNKIEAFTGDTVDRNFPTRRLTRSIQEHSIPKLAQEIYDELMALA
jgi:hypothetical protein